MPRRPVGPRASSLFALAILVAASVAFSAAPAMAADLVPTLQGVWKTDKGHYFEIVQEPNGTAIDSVMDSDPCTGGPRTWVIRGTLSGSDLAGTMLRCDELDHPLIVNCDLEPMWETTFTASVSDNNIVGEYEGEYWNYDYDDNGNLTGCTFAYNEQRSFSLSRVGCWIKSFEELGEEHFTDPARRAEEVSLAKRFEAGERVVWTQKQQEPGGMKGRVEAFMAELRQENYSASVTSAYRPYLYQAHFADLRLCALELIEEAKASPENATQLGAVADMINAEVMT